jgi:multimeric flavodoxin WrbA
MNKKDKQHGEVMKVTAFVGSARRGYTYAAVEKFLQRLGAPGEVEYEIVRLSDYNLGICRGCKLCLDRGEEFCPLKDDRDILMKKIEGSDGVVFATPNYSFQVSGLMKVFLDRFGFIFHRPRYFGKTFTGIVAQAVYGGNDILKYLDFVGNGLGFNTVKGCCIRTIEPMTEKTGKNNDSLISALAKKFRAELVKRKYPAPSLFKLMAFRVARSSMKKMLNEDFMDYNYYMKNGWFESDYYYPVKLGPLSRFAGRLFDCLGAKLAGNSTPIKKINNG